MIISQSGGALQGSLGDMWFVVLQFVPTVLAAAIVFIIGWIIGVILCRVIVEVVKVLRIDDVMKSAGVAAMAKDAGFKLDVGRFLGSLVMWFVILSSLAAALQILGLTVVTIVLEQVVLLYLPHVMVAVLILILAAVVAQIVRAVVATSARAAGSRHGNFAGTVAKWAIWIFAILACLDQLGVGSALIQTMFTGFVIAFSIAFGLAFGLGGKEAAARAIERVRSEISHEE